MLGFGSSYACRRFQQGLASRSWRRTTGRLILTALLVTGGPAACEREPDMPQFDHHKAWEALAVADSEQELDRELEKLDTVKIDPPPQVGVHYSVTFPPTLDFNPEEWLTNRPAPSVADPRAVKGGEIRMATSTWPPTIRANGPDARLAFLDDLHSMVYETLLDYDFAKSDFVPNLATHWWIGEDRRTFRFRLDPRARWADGTEVTADDVLATFEHFMNPDRKDPQTEREWKELVEEIKVLDKYTIEVRTREARWASLRTISLADAYIMPARYIRMDGETYINDWNWKLPPGSGPYEIRTEDVKKGRSITLSRRRDWWGAELARSHGMYNFDHIRWGIVRDVELMYQKLLKGELDVYFISRAQRWVDEVDKEPVVRNGWVQKRRIYSLDPNGMMGYCFNMRAEPFSSRNVRLAFTHLFNREKQFEKFFFYQYDYMRGYYPGQAWSRPGEDRVRYDPTEARRLLALDGWTDRDDKGHLVNAEGKPFPKLILEFSSPTSQRIHDVFKNALWQEAGVELELKILDYTSLSKKVWEKKFQLYYIAWTASLFPDPEFFWHSKFADKPQSINLPGFSNPEIDDICDRYKTEFDARKRKTMLQRVDQIVFDTHPYALAWYAPYFRMIYWDKFGHPREYTHRYKRDSRNLMYYWWFDEERASRTKANSSAGVPNYPEKPLCQYGAIDQKYWLDHELPRSAEGSR
ncbi:ABC transporter substrate-binding protein [Planctomycetota bacterium]